MRQDSLTNLKKCHEYVLIRAKLYLRSKFHLPKIPLADCDKDVWNVLTYIILTRISGMPVNIQEVVFAVKSLNNNSETQCIYPRHLSLPVNMKSNYQFK